MKEDKISKEHEAFIKSFDEEDSRKGCKKGGIKHAKNKTNSAKYTTRRS